jgi:hypothetical protein
MLELIVVSSHMMQHPAILFQPFDDLSAVHLCRCLRLPLRADVVLFSPNMKLPEQAS